MSQHNCKKSKLNQKKPKQNQNQKPLETLMVARGVKGIWSKHLKFGLLTLISAVFNRTAQVCIAIYNPITSFNGFTGYHQKQEKQSWHVQTGGSFAED